MKKAIIGKKVGMTQIFDETGKVVPVTVIEAGPCKVVQKKSAEKEGYASVQLGFEEIPERKLNKPEKGHLDKAGVGALRVLHEFRLENANEMNVGDVVKADAFKEGDKVDLKYWPRIQASSGNSLLSVIMQLSMSMGIAIAAAILGGFTGNGTLAQGQDVIAAFAKTYLCLGFLAAISTVIFIHVDPDSGKVPHKKPHDPVAPEH